MGVVQDVARGPSAASIRRHLADMLAELADLADVPGDPNLSILASQLRAIAQEAAESRSQGLMH